MAPTRRSPSPDPGGPVPRAGHPATLACPGFRCYPGAGPAALGRIGRGVRRRSPTPRLTDASRIGIDIISTEHPPRPRRLRRWAAFAALAATALIASGLSAPAAAAASGWTMAGPLAHLGGGRVWQVVFAPRQPALAAAATDNGVYLSSDGGQTWSLSGLRGVGVWTVAFDPSTSPETIYAGLKGSGGIRVSRDGGQSWSDASSGLPNRDVRCLVVAAGGIVAGTDDGVAISTDGRTWVPDGLRGDGVDAVAVVPTTPAPTLYAGIDYPSPSHGSLFRLGPTAGGTWTPVTHGLPATALVSSISVGPTSASVTHNPLLVTTTSGTYWSADGGNTWTASGGISNATLTDATFSPLDPNLVYAGADAGGSSGGGVWRSTDGGQTFSGFTQGLPTTHPKGEAPLQEVESLAVADGTPYPTVIAAWDPYDEGAAVYRQVDATAPQPPASPAASGATASIAAPSASAAAGGVATGGTPAPKPRLAPSSALASGVVGTIFHFPAPLIFEVLFVLLLVFIWVRWRRHYEVEGPP